MLETVEAGVEEGCVEGTSTAIEPLMNSASSGVYQMVTNADGTVSLVGLDPSQLDQMLHVQGNIHLTFSLLLSLLSDCAWWLASV